MILASLRLSGASRGPLVLDSSSLGPYFGCASAPKLSQKRVLLDFANPYETCDCMCGTHIAPPSLEHRNTTESEICQKHTKIAPRALQESAGSAQKRFRSGPENPREGRVGARGPPPESIVAPSLSPSVLPPTLWMVSLRNVRFDPKLCSASL